MGKLQIAKARWERMMNIGTKWQAIAVVVGSVVACASAVAAPAQRIGIKTDEASQKKIFYNKVTGAEFIPKGYNYTVLESRGTATQVDCKNRHVTFDVNKYSAWEAGRFLDDMVAGGFNTARVMLDFGDVCRQAVGQWSMTPPAPVGSELNTA